MWSPTSGADTLKRDVTIRFITPVIRAAGHQFLPRAPARHDTLGPGQETHGSSQDKQSPETDDLAEEHQYTHSESGRVRQGEAQEKWEGTAAVLR